uniref:Tc1-like transposase DDE domain-containing protein n=1 Tax=Caenorhabditis japonica TaxID=281687 RepID=A0A8R1DH93_CAEJA
MQVVKLFYKSKEFKPKTTTKERALALLSPEEKTAIIDHIQEHYATEESFTISSLLSELQEKYGFRFGRTTLFWCLKALRYTHRVNTYNPFATTRTDIIRMRRWYSREMSELRERGAHVSYFDETWLFHGMTRKEGWNREQSSAYEIAKLGNLDAPVPGFPAASDKGQRATVLGVLTETGMLPGSIKVHVSKRNPKLEPSDPHETMNSRWYGDYMAGVLPELAAWVPANRENILVIDNASYHNEVVERIPTKSSKKEELVEWMEKMGVSLDSKRLKEELWEEVEIFISSRGGRRKLQRYKVDEFASTLGVRIIRLPPYHCCLNPIEFIWGQLKDYLRKHGKRSDKVELVKTRAVHFLRNVLELGTIARTYEHVIDKEFDIWNIMNEPQIGPSDDELD